MTNSIEIRGCQDDILTASLPKILAQLVPDGKKLHWSILSLEAIGDLGDNKSIPEFENQIANSPEGLSVSWEELCELAEKFEQVIDTVIIGCKSKDEIRRYQDDNELHTSCDIVIDAFDSSYWRVYSKYQGIVDRLAKVFGNTEIVD